MAFCTAAPTRQPALLGSGRWRSPGRLATENRPLGAPSERYVPKGRPLHQGLPDARVFPPRSRPPILHRSLLEDASPTRARKPALEVPARAALPPIVPTVTNVTRVGTRRGNNHPSSSLVAAHKRWPVAVFVAAPIVGGLTLPQNPTWPTTHPVGLWFPSTHPPIYRGVAQVT